ncbi:MAG: hypothetical protein CMK78_09955 [Pseudomonadales bacterium]|nr:hypothetical protein [Pseudomonadales bacterium]
MSEDENAIEQTIYEDASFECSACKSVDQYTYADVTSLLSEEPIVCKSCGVSQVIRGEGADELSTKFNKAAKFGKLVFVIAIVFFSVSAVLGLIYGVHVSLGIMGVSMMICYGIFQHQQSEPHETFALCSAAVAGTTTETV